MERIPRKKRKHRIPASKVRDFAILAIVITIVLASIQHFNEEGIKIERISFETADEGVYVAFNIYNKEPKDVTCDISTYINGNNYQEQVKVGAKTTLAHKILVDMPPGKTPVELKYECK